MRIGVDVGGTFTDVVLVDDEHDVFSALKVPTTPREPERAVREALERTAIGATVTWIAHATTIATNALLGQIGLELPRVALIATEGFRDLVEIGRQNRSRVYDLFVERPKPLVAREDRFTVRERVDAYGEVVEPLDEPSLERAVAAIAACGIRSVAICLLNAYANPAHERRVQRRLREIADLPFVLCSSDVDPQYREYERLSTTVVSAALAPIVSTYLSALARDIRALGITAPLYVMRSDGGLCEDRVAALRPASLIESGPASGVIAAAQVARSLEIARALSFDMGGTTAKAGSILDGRPEIATEYEAAGATHSGRAVKGSGYPVRYPFVDLSEVSAGGGTIAWIDDAGSLCVGPRSAGADPGPACYGHSDRATVTDANVVLGRLHQTHLLGGAFPIDGRRSREAIAALAEPLGLAVEEAAAGIVTIVDAQMAKVLRIVTVERGLDPREFTMIAFGGNGPLHACALADELGVVRVLVPRHPGLFSAQGLLAADLSETHLQPVLRSTAEIEHAELERIFADLERCGRDALRAQGARDETMRVRRTYDARYRGQSFELHVGHDRSTAAIAQRFHTLHRARYGYAVEAECVELVNARATVYVERAAPRARTTPGAPAPGVAGRRRTWLRGGFAEVAVHERSGLNAGAAFDGPAIVEQYDCTTFVAPGWHAQVVADGLLSLGRAQAR
ncbi:MAG: hydantoinase/oxoprolinase family protein [Candidatus Tyrphobacter sp.]